MATRINHLSHGMGEAITGHSVPGNLARDGAPKKLHEIAVNSGMRATLKSGGDALSGHEASAIDAMSGATVQPGKTTSTAKPGWGNGTMQTGHPFATPPGSKRLTEAKPSWGAKDGDGKDCGDLADLGRAVLAEAAIGHRGKK